jgi:hypothetical protein
VVPEEDLQVHPVGLLRHLVRPEDWEEELVLCFLEGFVVAIPNRVLVELENLFR